MFETTIEKDLESATTEAEYESVYDKIYNKYREEFLSFIEELKQSGIAQVLYNSETPEETMSLWEKCASENQGLFARIKSWAEERDEYFSTYEAIPLFMEDEELEYVLEIGLILSIVKDESILNEEDINENFNDELIALLKKSSNRLLKAAGWYIDCEGYETMTKENIFDFYSED